MTGWSDYLRRHRLLVALAGLTVVVAAWRLVGGARDGDSVEWAAVERDDLVLGVEVEGTLRAVDTSSLGPPQVPWLWDFKISMMAPEGEDVTRGDPVLRFDTSELERQLEEKLAEAAEAGKEIEKEEAELRLQAEQDELRLAEAEGKRRKARLKVDVPATLSQDNELRAARLDLGLAEKEMAFLRDKVEAARRSGEASLDALRDQRARAERRVHEIREAIESMTVSAPRDGTVIYTTDWRGDKKKVGDSCWRGEKVLEIPNLDVMMAEGEVDEADASSVTVGQRLSLRLDAHPDEEFAGEVSSIWNSVERKSWRNPLKVVRLEIELDRTDVQRMRPGMRFVGKIETERIENALVIPTDTIFPGTEGPVVHVDGLMGIETVAVTLGRRSEDKMEVLAGLDEGDRIARADLSPRGAE